MNDARKKTDKLARIQGNRERGKRMGETIQPQTLAGTQNPQRSYTHSMEKQCMHRQDRSNTTMVNHVHTTEIAKLAGTKTMENACYTTTRKHSHKK